MYAGDVLDIYNPKGKPGDANLVHRSAFPRERSHFNHGAIRAVP